MITNKYKVVLRLIAIALLLTYCKKEVIELDRQQKTIELRLAVIGIDSIYMYANIVKDTSLIRLVENSAKFEIQNTETKWDTVIDIAKEISPNDDSISFEYCLRNTGIDQPYTIKAIAELAHNDFLDTTKEVVSTISKSIRTRNIELITDIDINSDSLELVTTVFVAGVRKKVLFDSCGHIIAGQRFRCKDLSSNDTFRIVEPTGGFDYPLTYDAYAYYGRDSIFSGELKISTDGCFTETNGVLVNLRPDTPSIFMGMEELIIDSRLVCDTPITINTQPVNGQVKISYRWSVNNTIDTTTLVPKLEVNQQEEKLASGLYNYSLEVLDGTCPSEFSNPIVLEVINMPEVLYINEKPECEQTTLSIANNDIDPYLEERGIIEWVYIIGEGNEQVVSNEQKLILPQDTFSDGKYKARLKYKNCYSDFSNTLEVKIIKDPSLESLEYEQEKTCAEEATTIKVDQMDDVSYFLLESETDPTAGKLLNGQYVFEVSPAETTTYTLTAKQGDCSSDTTFSINVNPKLSFDATAEIINCDSEESDSILILITILGLDTQVANFDSYIFLFNENRIEETRVNDDGKVTFTFPKGDLVEDTMVKITVKDNNSCETEKEDINLVDCQ